MKTKTLPEIREEIESIGEITFPSYLHSQRLKIYDERELDKAIKITKAKCEKACRCSKCDDTLENTQLICWTCHCEEKDKVRQMCEDAFKKMILGLKSHIQVGSVGNLFVDRKKIIGKEKDRILREALSDWISRRELLSQINSQTEQSSDTQEAHKCSKSDVPPKEKKQDDNRRRNDG